MSRAGAKAAAGRGVSVDCVPLTVDGRIRHTRVTADKSSAMVPRPGGAEIRESQVVEIEIAARVDSELGVTPARTRIRFPHLGNTSDNPLKCFAAIFGVPNPAGVRGERAGNAGVHAVRLCRIEPEVLLEADSLDPADRRLPERGRWGLALGERASEQ